MPLPITALASNGARRAAARTLAAVALAAAVPAASGAKDASSAGIVHWAYGSLLGTGAYRISGDRKAFVIQLPVRWTFSRAALGQVGERRLGIELRLPITLGVLLEDTIGDYRDQDTYGTVSFTPGLELEVPITSRWSLRPYFNVGYGSELGPVDAPDPSDPTARPDQNETAVIYQAGIKSRVALPSEIGTFGLLSAVQYAGYDPSEGPRSDLLVVMGGLETRQRLGRAMHGDHPLFWEAHATFSYVADLAYARDANVQPVGLEDFLEVGLAVSQGEVPFRFGFIPIERLGLAFQMSTNTEYRAIKLSFRSPFER